MKVECLKGLPMHLNCAEFKGTFCSSSVLLLSLDFFFFYFAIFCRQLHFVLIMAVPDATLNSMCLSPVTEHLLHCYLVSMPSLRQDLFF